MLRTGIETIICLSPNFLYVYVYVYDIVHVNDVTNAVSYRTRVYLLTMLLNMGF